MVSESLYTELIMMHNKSRHNRRTLAQPTAAERGHNPNCGDDLTLFLTIEAGVVKEAAYEGSGCAISQASLSMMIDLIKGHTAEAAKSLAQTFFKLVRGEVLTDAETEALGDAVIFENLSKMPARVKCGTLGWHCLDVALSRESHL